MPCLVILFVFRLIRSPLLCEDEKWKPFYNDCYRWLFSIFCLYFLILSVVYLVAVPISVGYRCWMLFWTIFSFIFFFVAVENHFCWMTFLLSLCHYTVCLTIAMLKRYFRRIFFFLSFSPNLSFSIIIFSSFSGDVMTCPKNEIQFTVKTFNLNGYYYSILNRWTLSLSLS